MPEDPPLDGCWDWRGTGSVSGYGIIQSRIYGPKYAHRVSHELHTGPILDGFEVLHSCDRPICVQPGHLRVGTHAENMREALDRKRYSRRGPKPVLTEEDIHLVLTSGLSERKLATQLGVSHTTIGVVRRAR